MKAGILLVVAVVVFRIVGAVASSDGGSWFLANFSPVGALVLCGGLFLPGRLAWLVPGAALLLTDAVLNLYYGYPALGWETLGTALAWGLVFGLAWILRGRVIKMDRWRGTAAVLGASLVSSLMFYAVTNTVSFLGSASYAQTFGGWVQALTVGVPGFPPTWVFFRNSVAGDLVFCVLFLSCVRPWVTGRREAAGAAGEKVAVAAR